MFKHFLFTIFFAAAVVPILAAPAQAVSYGYTARPESYAHLNFFVFPFDHADLFDGSWLLEHDPEAHTFHLALDSERLDFDLNGYWSPDPTSTVSNFFNPQSGTFAIPLLSGPVTLDGVTQTVSLGGSYLRASAVGDILYVTGEMSFRGGAAVTDIILEGRFDYNGAEQAVPEPATAAMLLVPLAASRLRSRRKIAKM